jgi:hypothetical protein
MLNDRLEQGPIVAVPDPPAWAATSTLRAWIARSADTGVAAEAETFADLHPLGRHWLTAAREMRRSGGRVIVAEFDLALVDGSRRTGYLPLPYREFTQAIDGADDRNADAWLAGIGAEPVPNWAGTNSFHSVLRSLQQVAQAQSLIREGRVQVPAGTPARLAEEVRAATTQPAAVLSLLAERHMRAATPIIVEPGLLAGLPSFDDAEEAFRYGEMLQLPFSAVYIDTAGQDGAGAHIALQVDRDHEVEFMLLGGLVWAERGGVSIMPVGYPAGQDRDAPPDFYGRALFAVKSSLSPVGMEPIALNEPRFGVETKILAVSPFAAVVLRGNVSGHASDPIEVLMRAGVLAGEIQLGGSGDVKALSSPGDEDDYLIGVARVVTQLACELLGVFYFLEIEGVELAPTPLPRPERRRAEREQRPIAPTALIHPGAAASASPSGARNDEVSDENRFSHRFFVRGHYRHHRPETSRVASARPDLVRPCPKPGCGECRRIPVAGHWKGPEDGPVVIKTRILQPRSTPPETE